MNVLIPMISFKELSIPSWLLIILLIYSGMVVSNFFRMGLCICGKHVDPVGLLCSFFPMGLADYLYLKVRVDAQAEELISIIQNKLKFNSPNDVKTLMQVEILIKKLEAELGVNYVT